MDGVTGCANPGKLEANNKMVSQPRRIEIHYVHLKLSHRELMACKTQTVSQVYHQFHIMHFTADATDPQSMATAAPGEHRTIAMKMLDKAY